MWFCIRKKTGVVSLWNDQATYLGQEIFDMADKSSVLAIKSLRVGDFQGVSFIAAAQQLYPNESGHRTSSQVDIMVQFRRKRNCIGFHCICISPSIKSGGGSMYSDRVTLHHIPPTHLWVKISLSKSKTNPGYTQPYPHSKGWRVSNGERLFP